MTRINRAGSRISCRTFYCPHMNATRFAVVTGGSAAGFPQDLRSRSALGSLVKPPLKALPHHQNGGAVPVSSQKSKTSGDTPFGGSVGPFAPCSRSRYSTRLGPHDTGCRNPPVSPRRSLTGPNSATTDLLCSRRSLSLTPRVVPVAGGMEYYCPTLAGGVCAPPSSRHRER